MKKLVTFRIEETLLAGARRRAQAENRSLTNFVETLLKQTLGVEPAEPTRPPPTPALPPESAPPGRRE